MRWIVRILSLLVLVASVVACGVFLNARLHPITCPGAFFGCAGNGEELGFQVALLSNVFAVIGSLFAVIETQRQHFARWQTPAIILLVVTLVCSPLLGGLLAVIFLSIISPDYGLYAYIAVSFVTGTLLARYGFFGGRVDERSR